MFDNSNAETENLETARHEQRARTRRPIVIVLHQEHSTPAHVGRTLRLMGHPLDIRKPRFGDPLPETLEEHDGAIIFGGPMMATDEDDFIKRETDWINVALEEKKPFLGICLGGQMLANLLGARVFYDEQERVEIGYKAVRPLAAPVDGVPWPTTVYQWHRQGFDLPSGAELLVTAEGAYPNQAFQYGSATGIQFHPEITYLQVNRWSGNNPGRLALNGAQDRPSMLRDHVRFAPAVERWRHAFLAAWVASGWRAGD